ncbi:MAG: hypothetical protein U0744_13390 [Gemmataceae bacterium]
MPLPSRLRIALPALLLLAAHPALGQQQLGTKTDVEDAFIRVRNAFAREYVTGAFEPKKDVLDLAAQYYVYRVTWPNATSDSATMAGVLVEFKALVDQITNKETAKKNQKFVNMFAPVLVARFRHVTDLPFQENQKAVLNGIQMLPQLGRINHDDIGKYFSELVDDPAKHDAIKLYALKGLRESMPIRVLVDEDWIANNLRARRDLDAKKIETLERFITRQAPTGMTDEETRAFAYIRKEAVAALANAGAPAVSAIIKREGDVKGAVAPTLLRVLIPALRADQNAPMNDMRLKPLPTIGEKVEAAIGVLNMHPEHRKFEMYQPQLSAYAFGRFVKELGEAYNEDLPNLRINVKDKDRRPPVLPWKLTAKRLEEAWVGAANTKPGLPAEFKKIEAPVKDILKQMYEFGNVADRMLELGQMLKAPDQKQRTLFPGTKGAQPLELD